VKVTRFTQTLTDLRPGDHLCFLYETEDERRDVLTPFLRQGLEQGEKALYIVASSQQQSGEHAKISATILGYLQQDGLDVEPYLTRRQLAFLTDVETYLRGGSFDPKSMIVWLQTETQQALIEGYSTLRVTSEMAWALNGPPGSRRLIEYEAKLNDVLSGCQSITLCQYDRRRFAPATLLDVLRTHPIAVVGTELHDNCYYIPPAELLGADLPESELRHWLQNLTEHRRTQEALRIRTHELDERVKELHCLYGISNLVEEPGVSLEEILQGVVDLIPPACRYPGDSCARITLERQAFATDNFEETAWKQTSDIIVRGERVGCLEVCYLGEQAEGNAEPVLREERDLLNAITGRLGRIIERRQAEDKVRRHEEQLAILNVVAATVSRSLDLERVLNDALSEVLRLDVLGPEARASICLLDEQTGDLVLAAQQGAPQGFAVEPIEWGDRLCGQAIQAGEVIISDDCWQDEQRGCCWPSTAPHKEICLPLKARDRVLGVLNLWLPLAWELTTGNVDLLTLISEQISVAIQNARLFQAVRQQHGQLRALSARLAEVEEIERQQLARELHDQVGQNLTALGINLNIARAQMPDTVPMGDAARVRLDDSLALVEQTTERIRDVMANLRSPVMDDYGLVAALQWYARQLSSRANVDVAVQGQELVPRLASRIENALFRIAQEALTNVIKHAQATQATVTVDADGDTVRLVIADDGSGFDPGRLRTADGRLRWGLLTMTERAEAVGGHCRIESHPQTGTQVIVEVTL
jgi:signal transduction histidine kinase